MLVSVSLIHTDTHTHDQKTISYTHRYTHMTRRIYIKINRNMLYVTFIFCMFSHGSFSIGKGYSRRHTSRFV